MNSVVPCLDGSEWDMRRGWSRQRVINLSCGHLIARAVAFMWNETDTRHMAKLQAAQARFTKQLHQWAIMSIMCS